MTDRIIRPATPADIPAITAIYGHSVATETASFEFDPPSEAEMARRMARLREAGLPLSRLRERRDGARLCLCQQLAAADRLQSHRREFALRRPGCAAAGRRPRAAPGADRRDARRSGSGR